MSPVSFRPGIGAVKLRPRRSKPSPTHSTADHARPSAGRLRPKHSTTNYNRYEKPVLQRSIEPSRYHAAPYQNALKRPEFRQGTAAADPVSTAPQRSRSSRPSNRRSASAPGPTAPPPAATSRTGSSNTTDDACILPLTTRPRSTSEPPGGTVCLPPHNQSGVQNRADSAPYPLTLVNHHDRTVLRGHGDQTATRDHRREISVPRGYQPQPEQTHAVLPAWAAAET